jgi:hypothetical protein
MGNPPLNIYSDFAALCDRFGNVASVLGFLIAIVGFGVTIWSVGRARRAAEAARAAVREAVEKIGSQLFDDEVVITLRYIQAARDACRVKNWAKASDRCEEAMEALARAVMNPRLIPTEGGFLTDAIDDLRLIARRLDEMHGSAATAPGLSREKRKQLDVIAVELNRIRARLRNALLEA